MNQLQLKIMMALPQLDEGDTTVTQLAQLLAASKSAVSRACYELEKAGRLAKCRRAKARNVGVASQDLALRMQGSVSLYMG